MATDETPTRSIDRNDQCGRKGRDGENEQNSRTAAAATDERTIIRPYTDADRTGVLDLYETVGRKHVDAWFRWKYEENPYSDDGAVLVADRAGEVVAVGPCFTLEFEAGGRPVRVEQPADVEFRPGSYHEELERQLLDQLESYCRDRASDLCTTVASGDDVSTHRDLGWEAAGPAPTYYRLQRPGPMLGGDDDRPRAIGRASSTVSSLYYRARERAASTPANVTVNRFADIPIQQFVTLAAHAPPGLHATRDERFYEWRFANPLWSVDAYLATRGGEPIAGAITGTKTERDGTELTCLFDVAPLAPTRQRDDGLRAILERLLADRRDADLVSASGTAMPAAVVGQFGFVSIESLPLSLLGSATSRLAVPIGTEGDRTTGGSHPMTVAGRAIADPSNWTTTFADRAW